MRHVFESEQRVARPRSEVFAFFSDAANLQHVTPESLDFQILTPLPISMKPGALIDYRIRLFGVRFRWRTLIERFEPEKRFVDLQLSGPYHHWRHLHEFQDDGGGTLMRDRVEYEVPLGPLGELFGGAFVRRQVEHIFSYRREVIGELFR